MFLLQRELGWYGIERSNSFCSGTGSKTQTGTYCQTKRDTGSTDSQWTKSKTKQLNMKHYFISFIFSIILFSCSNQVNKQTDMIDQTDSSEVIEVNIEDSDTLPSKEVLTPAQIQFIAKLDSEANIRDMYEREDLYLHIILKEKKHPDTEEAWLIVMNWLRFDGPHMESKICGGIGESIYWLFLDEPKRFQELDKYRPLMSTEIRSKIDKSLAYLIAREYNCYDVDYSIDEIKILVDSLADSTEKMEILLNTFRQIFPYFDQLCDPDSIEHAWYKRIDVEDFANDIRKNPATYTKRDPEETE